MPFFPIPATWWVRLLTHALAAGVGAFGAYVVIDAKVVDPLKVAAAKKEQKTEDTKESVDNQSKSEAEILREKEDAVNAAVQDALNDYKRKHPQGARRPSVCPPTPAASSASSPEGTGITMPTFNDYQVLSDDGLDTARRIFGQPARSLRGTHLDDKERRIE